MYVLSLCISCFSKNLLGAVYLKAMLDTCLMPCLLFLVSTGEILVLPVFSGRRSGESRLYVLNIFIPIACRKAAHSYKPIAFGFWRSEHSNRVRLGGVPSYCSLTSSRSHPFFHRCFACRLCAHVFRTSTLELNRSIITFQNSLDRSISTFQNSSYLPLYMSSFKRECSCTHT